MRRVLQSSKWNKEKLVKKKKYIYVSCVLVALAVIAHQGQNCCWCIVHKNVCTLFMHQ